MQALLRLTPPQRILLITQKRAGQLLTGHEEQPGCVLLFHGMVRDIHTDLLITFLSRNLMMMS